jgi:hypothetical protein
MRRRPPPSCASSSSRTTSVRDGQCVRVLTETPHARVLGGSCSAAVRHRCPMTGGGSVR